MYARTRIGMRVSVNLAAMMSLALCASASGELNIAVDPDGDGVYEKTRIYPVSYEEAIQAFSDAGGAPWDGTGPVLGSVEIDGVRFSEAQSWDGFIAFLDKEFPGSAARTTQACDDSIIVLGGFTWDCPVNNCTPTTDCEGQTVNMKPGGGWRCKGGGNPVCPIGPDGKPVCVKTGVPLAITGASWDGAGPFPCECPTGAGSDCTKNTNATATAIAWNGTICACAVPAVSIWGVVVMVLLTLSAGTLVLKRRRRLAAGA